MLDAVLLKLELQERLTVSEILLRRELRAQWQGEIGVRWKQRVYTPDRPMCGRYTLGKVHELVDRFSVAVEDISADPRFNVSPSQHMPVVVREESNRLTLMQWGLLPSWAKDPKTAPRPINARIEGVLTKPTFRGPVRKHRCLVPADGFYEWKKEGKAKTPYYIRREDGALFAFAGFFDTWHGPGGEVIDSYAIMTTKPNSLLAQVHDRMPVILDPVREGLWLDTSTDIDSLLESLQQPFAADQLEVYRVGTQVNSPRNDFPELVQRG